MRMAYEFRRHKCVEDYYHNFESTKILSNRSQQEISPDTPVEVNPVPPLGWRRMADPPGNMGQAPLDLLQRDHEPSLSRASSSASSSASSRIQRLEDGIRRLMELTPEWHSDIPEGSETRAPNAAGPATYLASNARSTSSCSSTSTSPKITDLTRKPLPDCEIGQISPPNGCIASSINSKREFGVTPKEPPIPSYATSHLQFDHAVSMGWNIAMFLVCGGWHEPEEPIIGPVNVPPCLRGPGFVQDLADGPELDADGHLIQVPESLTNGAEVFYDRATNHFIESECDYDSDEDEDPGLHEEPIRMDQPRNYSRVMSSSGLTNWGEHADASAQVPRQAGSSATVKTSSTPPDPPGGGGIEPTSLPKSITSLGTAPRDYAWANPSPYASDPGMLHSISMAQAAPTHHGEVSGPSTDLHGETTNFQGHRRQSTAPPSPAVKLSNAGPAAPPRAPLTANVPTPQGGSGPPAISSGESPLGAGGLAPCQVGQPSATGSSDSITGLAKLEEGSYSPRIADSRGEIIHRTFVSAPSGALKFGSGSPTVLDVTKATAWLESAEDAGSILGMAAAPNAVMHTRNATVEAKCEVSPQGFMSALSDPVATGPSPASQSEAIIVAKLREWNAKSDAAGQAYVSSRAHLSPGLDSKQTDADQGLRSGPPQAVGKSSTCSVIPIGGLLTPKSSYLADQGVTLGIGETSPAAPCGITPLPTLKTEIVANPLTQVPAEHRPSCQVSGLPPEHPESRLKPMVTTQGFTSSNGPENPGFKVTHGPRGDANSSSVQPTSIQGLSIHPGGQHDPDLCLEGTAGLQASFAKPAEVARMTLETLEVCPTLTLLATGQGPVDPHTQTTLEPTNQVGGDLPDPPQPPDLHKLQEGRPPDRAPSPHRDHPGCSNSTAPTSTPRLDLDPENKTKPRPPSTRAQSGNSLKITKEAQHHGNPLLHDRRYGNACPRANCSWSTDQAADVTPTPPPRQPWHPTRQGHIPCLV